MRWPLGICALSIMIVAGCSGGARTSVQSVSPQAPSAPVTIDTATLNENLFNQNENAAIDIPPAAPTLTTPPVYRESDVNCLSYDSGLLPGLANGSPYSAVRSASPVYSEPNTALGSTAANSCLAPGAVSYGQDGFLQEVLLSMGSMRSGFDLVVGRKPAANASASELSAHFEEAKRALVRCYRQVLARQLQIAQWSNQSIDRFEQVDANLFQLLNLAYTR